MERVFARVAEGDPLQLPPELEHLRLEALAWLPETSAPSLYRNALPDPQTYWPWYRLRAIELVQRTGDPSFALSLLQSCYQVPELRPLICHLESMQTVLRSLESVSMQAGELETLASEADEISEALRQLARKLRFEESTPQWLDSIFARFVNKPAVLHRLSQELLPVSKSLSLPDLLQLLIATEDSKAPFDAIIERRIAPLPSPLLPKLQKLQTALKKGHQSESQMIASYLFYNDCQDILGCIQGLLERIVSLRTASSISLDQISWLQRFSDLSDPQIEFLCIDILQLLS